MRLAIYSKEAESVAKKLGVGFESGAFGEITRFFSSPETLASRLIRLHYAGSIVVMVVKDKQELSGLLRKLPLIRRARIILILPDREPETIKAGYRFEPRFMSFIDSDFGKVKAVLLKMIAKSRSFQFQTMESRGEDLAGERLPMEMVGLQAA